MKIAIWVIAICEVVRALQNMVQLRMVYHDTGARENAYAEFVKSLKNDDKEFVRDLLEEFDRQFVDDVLPDSHKVQSTEDNSDSENAKYTSQDCPWK